MNNLELYEKGRPIAYRISTNATNAAGVPIHWHEQTELIYSLSGNLTVQCGNKTYNLKKGNLVFINSNELHSIKGKNYVCIKFNSLFLPEIYENNNIYTSLIKNDKIIIDLFEKIISEEENDNEVFSFTATGLIYELAAHIIRNYKTTPDYADHHFAKLDKSKKILKALDYIAENYNKKISVEYLSEECFLSKQYFCSLFKNLTGYSPVNYINNLRMEKAKELLNTTELSITEIASETGFDDSSYFSKIFKNHYGKSPKEYKDGR